MKLLDKIITVLMAAAVPALLVAVVNMPVQHAKGQSTALGPTGTSVALNAGTPVQIVGTNPTRKGLTFCNPTAVVEFVAPAGTIVLSTAAVGIGLPAIASGVTSCINVPGPALTGIAGIGSAWNGTSASATPNITVLEYF